MNSLKKSITFCSYTFSIIALVYLFIACGDKSSEMTREEIELNSFSVAHVDRISNIVLIKDSCYKLILEGSQEVIQSIGWEITDDTLRIRATKGKIFKIEEIPAIRLHFINLKSLATFKPSTVCNIDTLNLDYFYYYSVGEIGEADLTVNCNTFGLDNSANTLGKFHIRGSANQVYIFNRYGCSMFADSLLCKTAQVINESVGDVYINASETLRVYIWGTGNIFYYGNPELQIADKRGSGQLLQVK